MTPRQIIAATLAFLSISAMAQTVYETKGKDGPVFSDKPSAGAASVDLPPPNVISMPTVEPTQAPPAAAPLPYRDLVITAPEAKGMIHTNTGAFEIRARLAPALRKTDRILVSLDGNVLKPRFRSTHVQVTEADWNAAASGDDGLHTVQLTVVDAKGEPLIASAPVAFYVQRATVARQRRAR